MSRVFPDCIAPHRIAPWVNPKREYSEAFPRLRDSIEPFHRDRTQNQLDFEENIFFISPLPHVSLSLSPCSAPLFDPPISSSRSSRHSTLDPILPTLPNRPHSRVPKRPKINKYDTRPAYLSVLSRFLHKPDVDSLVTIHSILKCRPILLIDRERAAMKFGREIGRC